MRSREEILQKKWQRLLQHRRFFHLIPFIDFVLVSGSMALGTAREESDFDVIVGARAGRIFTVRFLSIITFGLLGIRRKGVDHKKEARDKICFNHFVTPRGYILDSPYGEYWVMLYQNLIPLYGSERAVKAFFAANKWAGRKNVTFDARWSKERKSFMASTLETLLSGGLGDWFERLFRTYQIKRIEKGISNGALGYKPQIVYDDTELRFHVDTKRIEEMKLKVSKD